jgi:hypothetical protein
MGSTLGPKPQKLRTVSLSRRIGVLDHGLFHHLLEPRHNVSGAQRWIKVAFNVSCDKHRWKRIRYTIPKFFEMRFVRHMPAVVSLNVSIDNRDETKGIISLSATFDIRGRHFKGFGYRLSVQPTDTMNNLP